MPLKIEPRQSPSRLMAALSPLIAVALTVLTGALMLALLGKDPGRGLMVFFVDPLLEPWSREEVLVKATPLALIAVGLSIAYLANVWNIGAEGQLIMGAVFGGALPVLFPDWLSPAALPLMLALGALGGAAWAMIPALLKVRFGASEILTTLMLVSVAELFLDWLVRGPWRDPQGNNFPQSAPFHEFARMPVIGDDRLNIGLIFALAAALVAAAFLYRTLAGFSLRISGSAPRAARFAGVSRGGVVVMALGVSGALAGLAGVIEAAGPIGRLQPDVSPGYGFTAIIVAFLGRLNPLGALAAAFLLSLTFIGGEAAQIELRLSDKMTRVFQGVLLIYLLACDAFIHQRLRLRPRAAGAASAPAGEGAK